jgi:hypothetical protein
MSKVQNNRSRVGVSLPVRKADLDSTPGLMNELKRQALKTMNELAAKDGLSVSEEDIHSIRVLTVSQFTSNTPFEIISGTDEERWVEFKAFAH